MSKKVKIQAELNKSPQEFEVGKFVTLLRGDQNSLTPQRLLGWINDLAGKGLIYHSEYQGEFIFRVDGAVIEQLKNELELTSETKSSYTGGDPLYEDYTTLQLYLDGDVVSTVDLP